MNASIQNCPFCNLYLGATLATGGGRQFRVECDNCGNYVMTNEYWDDNIVSGTLDARKRATLSHAVRRLQRPDVGAPLVIEETANAWLAAVTLPTAPQQVDLLVLHLGGLLAEPGATESLESARLLAVLGSQSAAAVAWIVQQAQGMGLVQIAAAPSDHSGVVFLDTTLSIRGWQRYADLQNEAKDNTRAFMAMKFGDAELDRVFRECFKVATKRAGFDLFKLDDEPRAGLIDDRLRLEIRTSRFLVADLTHANNGAYWEAGYAEGLGRPVIYTCKKSVFDDPVCKPHFDTNHHLCIVWDPGNLQAAADQLATTIRATLPTEAKLND